MSVTDDFNRADGTAGANWGAGFLSAGVVITSNKVTGGDAGNYAMGYWAGTTFNADHTAQITMSQADHYIGPGVRCDATAGYVWFSHGFVQRVPSGANIAQVSGFTTNDVAKMTATGSTLEFFKNGVSQGTVTDSAYTAGGPGIGTFTNSARADDFVGTGEVGGAIFSTKFRSRQAVNRASTY